MTPTFTPPKRSLVPALLCLALLSPPASHADPSSKPPRKSKLTASTFSGIKLRNVGPAFMSGRIADIAIDPIKPNTWYVAAGSGGLWKTVNAGTTWKPIFDNHDSYSIGCLTLDPNNHHTLYVGTGESVGGRHVGFGDGLYKSLNGGQSFENIGLKESEHIAKIIVHPTNPRTLYVAAQGPLWSPGGDRGLFQSTDAGKTWKRILAQGPFTGVTDLALDPHNPTTLYAATHQRHRTVWALVNGGPESGIHKSTDAGKTWRQLSRGLPGQDKGKIALAISPSQPEVLYASIELAGRSGGFWRSADAGETWTKMSDYISGATGPHYYQEIWCDPHRFDVIYQANVRLGRSEDGGRSWTPVESSAKHVDNHALAFLSHDPDFLLVGCDGGLYRSFDRGKTYQFFPNLPLTQFYKLDVDYDQPFYHIVGGTQDNSTQYGPSQTAATSGIRNSDWRIILGGDGHDCAIDPQDPDIIYGESQNGYLHRIDRRTGEAVDIRPRPEPGEEDFRFNWDSPVLISPHSHTRIYLGSKQLHRSDNRGDSWKTISPDLSRAQDRYKLELMNRVWSIDALYDNYAMSQYGNITSISESPLQEGLIYVGTDDGLIQVTEDHGLTWRKIPRLPGVPEFSFVNDIKADRHDTNTVYAALDNHKTGDFKPYLVQSTDRGQSWSSLTGNLPDRLLLWRIEQDHLKPNLFFLGTEFGLFFTLDTGTHWTKLNGNVPTIPFRDLAVQRRENDLVGATFGRGFYILDDYSFLRELSEEKLKEPFLLFPVRPARLYTPDRVLGGQKGSQGDSFFTAPNPPFGAVFTYYLRDDLKTRKQRRQEREKKIKKEGGDNFYPGWDKLREEDREESPVILFTITDAGGQLVARLAGPLTSGFHRVNWDLRHPAPADNSGNGPRVAPGTYSVSATKTLRDKTTPLGTPQPFQVVPIGKPALPTPDRHETLQFQLAAGDLLRVLRGTHSKIEEVLGQLAKVKSTLRRRPDQHELFDQTRKLELELLTLRDLLAGDPTKSKRSEPTPPSTLSRINTALNSLRSSYGPTQTHRRELEIARQQYGNARKQIDALLDKKWGELQVELNAARIPWTPGRPAPAL